MPPEDQGYIISSIMLPDGATLQRTAKTGAQLQQRLAKDPTIDHMFVAPGRDFIGGGNKPNAGTSFILLKHWDERKKTAPQLAAEVSRMGFTFPDGIVIAFNPPAIRGLGSAGGFEVYRAGARRFRSQASLAGAAGVYRLRSRKHPDLQGINTFFRPTVPQLFVEVNREQAMALGVPVSDVFDALQSTMGPLYVNDFNMSGRTYRVQVQADAPYRAQPEDVGRSTCARIRRAR